MVAIQECVCVCLCGRGIEGGDRAQFDRVQSCRNKNGSITAHETTRETLDVWGSRCRRRDVTTPATRRPVRGRRSLGENRNGGNRRAGKTKKKIRHDEAADRAALVSRRETCERRPPCRLVEPGDGSANEKVAQPDDGGGFLIFRRGETDCEAGREVATGGRWDEAAAAAAVAPRGASMRRGGVAQRRAAPFWRCDNAARASQAAPLVGQRHPPGHPAAGSVSLPGGRRWAAVGPSWCRCALGRVS